MNRRTVIFGITSLIIGLMAFGVAYFMAPPIFKDSQEGVFTVASCGAAGSRRGPGNVTCNGQFSASGKNLISSNPSYITTERQSHVAGTILPARLYKDGTVVTDQSQAVYGSIYMFIGGLVFSAVGIGLLVVSRKKLNPKNTKVGLLLTGQDLPVFSPGVSAWSQVAFFSAIGCLILIPGPIAFVSGIAGIIDSHKNNKKGVWRAWVGLVVGFIATIWHIYLIATMFS